MKKFLLEVQKFISDTSTTFDLRVVAAFFLFFFCCCSIEAQERVGSFFIDTSLAHTIDTPIIKGDTSYLSVSNELANLTSIHLSEKNKNFIFDFQTIRQVKSDNWIFIWIFIAVVILAIFKNLFKNESDDFFTQVLNISVSNNLGRMKVASLSVFSFFLIMIFTVNFSLITSTAIQYFFPNVRYDTLSLTIILFFLFTLFIAIKVVVVNLIGFIFDETDASKFYVHEFMMFIQTIGISIFPLIIISTLVPQRNFIFLFYALLIVLFFFFLYFALRGLSTSLNLMYKSLYHFLLYICVEEILVVFLFIKLLTKIAF
jgi:hypothetical protein